MNEKLQKALENILENEQEADKFAKFETVDEMYSYFKKEIPDLDEEEFNDFIDEILEWYESNEESIEKLQEDSLNNVSGGANSIARFGAGIFAMLALLPGMQNVDAAKVKSTQNHAVAKLQKIAKPKPAVTPAAPDAKPKFDISRYLKSETKDQQKSKQVKSGSRMKTILKIGAVALMFYAAHKAGLTKYVNEKYGITDKLNSLMPLNNAEHQPKAQEKIDAEAKETPEATNPAEEKILETTAKEEEKPTAPNPAEEKILETTAKEEEKPTATNPVKEKILETTAKKEEKPTAPNPAEEKILETTAKEESGKTSTDADPKLMEEGKKLFEHVKDVFETYEDRQCESYYHQLEEGIRQLNEFISKHPNTKFVEDKEITKLNRELKGLQANIMSDYKEYSHEPHRIVSILKQLSIMQNKFQIKSLDQ